MSHDFYTVDQGDSKLSASQFYVNIISVHIYAQLRMYISILISMIRRSLTVAWVLFKI